MLLGKEETGVGVGSVPAHFLVVHETLRSSNTGKESKQTGGGGGWLLTFV